MITYLYWLLTFLICGVLVYFLGLKASKWKLGGALACILLLASWTAYYFHFQNVFVKRYGGVMTIVVPEGQFHIGSTWKDDNLWIENFDPKTNSCIFSEYSKGNLLQGRVTIKNCNPLIPKQ